MSIDVDSIKRKLLVKYPTFGSVIVNLEFQESEDLPTAGTNGKLLLYNPKFIGSLSEKEQIFIFAHEVCHVAFEHIFRSEGKDKRLWNIATDSVINALLKQAITGNFRYFFWITNSTFIHIYYNYYLHFIIWNIYT